MFSPLCFCRREACCAHAVQDIEKALMRADVDRDKLKDRHNRPDAVAKGLELNDASRVQRRSKMMLPAPQVSEQELQQIAKGGGDVDMDPELAEGGTDATRRLLGDYQTPQRWILLYPVIATDNQLFRAGSILCSLPDAYSLFCSCG